MRATQPWNPLGWGMSEKKGQDAETGKGRVQINAKGSCLPVFVSCTKPYSLAKREGDCGKNRLDWIESYDLRGTKVGDLQSLLFPCWAYSNERMYANISMLSRSRLIVRSRWYLSVSAVQICRKKSKHQYSLSDINNFSAAANHVKAWPSDSGPL